MEFELKILFSKSSSKYYKDAIKEATQFSRFSPIADDNTQNIILIDQEEFKAKFREIQKLFSIIANWIHSALFFNNKKISFWEIHSFLDIITCQNRCDLSPNHEIYCQDENDKLGWGCKHLTKIRRQITSNAFYYKELEYWFNYGYFESEGIWVINKQNMLNVLNNEFLEKRINVCKHISFDKLKQTVDSLPDRINVKENAEWEIVFEEISDGIISEKRPINIKPKSMKNAAEGHGFGIRFDLSTFRGAKDEENSNDRFIPNVTFDKIGGIDNIISIIREVIELPLKAPELFEYLGIKPHKGILLYGPPGCGKTLIAKAIANEINAHFIPIKGPELLSKWHGESEGNLRDVFEEARKFSPSIVYFDEIDSIAQSRSSAESLRLDARFVNQLLTLMDGIEEYGNVCVIASTNRKELIDEALLRPGRFDYSIEIEKPTHEGCVKIFQIHTQQMPIENTFDTAEFSNKLHGLSGAEIAFVAREGAYNCLRKNIEINSIIVDNNAEDINLEELIICEDDFEKALSKIKNNNTDKSD